MGVHIELSKDALGVNLSGWDRVMVFRRHVTVPRHQVRKAFVGRRSELEAPIDSRVIGFGTDIGHRGRRFRRVGVMLGRAVVGHQFWAVSSGADEVAVVETDGHEFRRLVLQVPDPSEFVTRLP